MFIKPLMSASHQIYFKLKNNFFIVILQLDNILALQTVSKVQLYTYIYFRIRISYG